MRYQNTTNSFAGSFIAACFMFPLVSIGGAANTSATAGSDSYGPGTAAAAANYDGNGIGFTKTNARSGNVNLARGLAVGFDETGLSVSHSYAIAPRRGPGVGGTLNLHVGQQGVAVSGGRTVASQDRTREVRVSGQAGSNHGRPVATAAASGRTGGRGIVEANTFSRTRERSRYERPRYERTHRDPSRYDRRKGGQQGGQRLMGRRSSRR